MFTLHPRLAADTVPIVRLRLSAALLMNDQRYPWVILVPERPGITELHQLGDEDRYRLMDDITLTSSVLSAVFQPDKINVGALGNIVPQLHVHVIARSHGDAAWPGPVWGKGTAEAYDAQALASRTRLLAERLQHPNGVKP